MKYSGWDHQSRAFSAQRLDEIVLLKFSKNPMLLMTDLTVKKEIIEYLNRVSDEKTIKIAILMSNPENRGREEYHDFFKRLLNSQIDRTALMRMYNAVNQIIIKIMELDQVTIHVNSGRVIMMYLNLSLACDFRIVGDNTVFQNPCLELGMIPKGGGAYLLSKKLGQAKAFELMLSCRDFDAGEALELGLVNEVAPASRLEETALETANLYIKNPADSLFGVKRLLNFCLQDFREFLEYENREIMRIVDNRLLSKAKT